MLTYNLELKDDTGPKGVLIVRLDNSAYVLHMHSTREEACQHDAAGSWVIGKIPSLWEWIRIWFQLRPHRLTQRGEAEAAINWTQSEELRNKVLS